MYVFKEMPAASIFKWHYNLNHQLQDTQYVTFQAYIHSCSCTVFPQVLIIPPPD